MDETRDLLRAIMGRLEEMGAEQKGMRAEIKELRGEVNELRAEVRELRADTNERLEKVEERLDWLAAKWMEHDAEIHKLKKKQA